MKTLRKTAEEAYLKYANKIINRETWIDGFISGIQYKKEYPQSIELCGLLWDTENLAIGGYEKDGLHMAGGNGCREVCREALADLAGMGGVMRSRLDLGRRVKGPLVRG